MTALRVITPADPDVLGDPQALAAHLRVTTVDVPTPRRNEVLIKIDTATLNPNDLYHVTGRYTGTRDLAYPSPTGFEGAGRVVAAGNPAVAAALSGKPVAFYALGAFADYVVCDAMGVIPLSALSDLAVAARSVANPMTAMSMVAVIKKAKARTVVNTAAAGTLGQLLSRLCAEEGIDVIAVVRCDEQLQACLDSGARYALNSSAAGFDEELRRLCRETGCRLAFDCVAGDMPGRLLDALGDPATVSLYGYLTPGDLTLAPQSLFDERTLNTFEVNAYLSHISVLEKARMAWKIRQGIGTQFDSTLHTTYPLAEAVSAYSLYSRSMSTGKIQLAMSREP